MNSTGQGLETNPLLASTVQSSQLASNRVAHSATAADNALNTKEFSDVMDKQQATEKVAAASQSDNASSDGLTANVPAEPSLAAEPLASGSAVLATQPGLDGKLLPVDGDSLPLGYLVRGVVPNQQSGGFQAALELTDVTGGTSETIKSDGIGLPGEGFVYGAELATLDPEMAATNPYATINMSAGAAGNLPRSPDVPTGSRSTIASRNNAAMVGEVAPALPSHGTSGSRITDAVTPTGSTGFQFPSQFPVDGFIAASVNSSDSQVVGSVVAGLAQAFNAGGHSANSQLNKMLTGAAGIIAGRQSLAVSSDDSMAGSVVGQETQSQGALVSLVGLDASQTYKATSAEAPLTSVPVTVGKPGWSDAVMQRVMWMSSQNINRVDIVLDPPDLGPLQVRIVTQADQTSVTFSSNHGSVREALDQSLPRLREMMDNQGLNLTDVNVSDQSANRQQHESAANPDGQDQSEHYSSSGQAGENDEAESMITPVSLSLVDQYV